MTIVEQKAQEILTYANLHRRCDIILLREKYKNGNEEKVRRIEAMRESAEELLKETIIERFVIDYDKYEEIPRYNSGDFASLEEYFNEKYTWDELCSKYEEVYHCAVPYSVDLTGSQTYTYW